MDLYKKRVIEQWTINPIGSGYSIKEIGTKEWFDEIYQKRFEIQQTWMRQTFKFENYKNKKILEIGVGVGSDHLEMAKNGAILTGIDITPKSIELTKKNLKYHGYKSDLLIADAENLPFADNSFDIVYSFGVLHHVPDIQKAIDEIHRVLKSGSKSIVAIYHRNSMVYKLSFLPRIWFQKLKEGNGKPISEYLSLIEAGGEKTKPLVKLFSKKEARNLFKKFSRVKIYTRGGEIGFSESTIAKVSRTWPFRVILKYLSKWFGWFLIIEASK